MNTVFNNSDYLALVKRIEKLGPDASRQWGKMNVSQMLAHCSETTRMALGEVKLKRLLIGRIFGPLARKNYLGPDPFARNSPTAAEFRITDNRDFEKEKQRLLGLLKRLHEAGETGVTRHPHGFFGELSPQQWGVTQWKHYDHHLRQFGA